MATNVIALYREGVGRQLIDFPWSAAATYRVRYFAWKHVRNELSWSITYDVAHDRTPDTDEVEAWLRIIKHMHELAERCR